MTADLLGLAGYLVFFLVIALNYSLVCLGLNLQWGVTGLFNVGVAGFFAIGAYATAILTGPDYASSLGGFGLPVPVGWIGAVVASGIAALVVGIPSLRLRQDYLAITTFGIAVTVQLIALNFEPLTGGAFGLGSIPRPLAGAFATPFGFNLFYLGVSILVVAGVYALLEILVRSPWGRVLRGIREDEAAAQSLGKHPFAFRLQAFVIGSMVMGLAGGMYASFVGFIAPEDFLPILTFQVWTMLVVGGSGSNKGAILGGIVVWAIWAASGALIDATVPTEMQAQAAALRIVLIGVLLSGVLVVRPKGLIGGA
ncbi:branched-chain amino acid transport system permease protein [Inquilinus ginsengisoli]|uniref:Branched-chain amino acid transport system permease protein n=1 Tax=Inquilinus ginsengisoli TaxID=363840 RepID=A0ABU1JLE9_9PROT|nr:branched-chain amino acid ABC transporter permease [Inquilinus ginsengisoli]MDR6289163.1 branched-chain amino acid transport system permease protein [Inquilinus ginsengisoli]